MVLNNYWFLLCRTLMNERVWWIILPILAYGVSLLNVHTGQQSAIRLVRRLGRRLYPRTSHLHGVFAAIVVLWFINRGLMIKLIYNEINKVEDTKVKACIRIQIPGPHGEIGEYMRLELKCYCAKSLQKTALRTVFLVVISFTCILSFTEAYDGQGMKSFILVYNFVIFGILFLSSLMSYEGNYIDGIDEPQESIYTAAPNIFCTARYSSPLFLMIPAMANRQTVCAELHQLELCLLPVAVYISACSNWPYTITGVVDLNAKMTNRQNMGTGLQESDFRSSIQRTSAYEFCADNLFGPTVTAWILIAIGAGFILTSRFWLKMYTTAS